HPGARLAPPARSRDLCHRLVPARVAAAVRRGGLVLRAAPRPDAQREGRALRAHPRGAAARRHPAQRRLPAGHRRRRPPRAARGVDRASAPRLQSGSRRRPARGVGRRRRLRAARRRARSPAPQRVPRRTALASRRFCGPQGRPLNGNEMAALAHAFAPEPDDEQPGLSILEHLDELRTRLVRSCIAIAAGTLVAFFFIDRIVAFVFAPMRAALARSGHGTSLIYTAPGEAFALYVNIALIAGATLASPFVLFQLWRFLAPALYANEKRFAIPFVLMSSG